MDNKRVIEWLVRFPAISGLVATLLVVVTHSNPLSIVGCVFIALIIGAFVVAK